MNLLDIRVPPMVPVAARALAGMALMLIVNSSTWNGLSLGVPTVVL